MDHELRGKRLDREWELACSVLTSANHRPRCEGKSATARGNGDGRPGSTRHCEGNSATARQRRLSPWLHMHTPEKSFVEQCRDQTPDKYGTDSYVDLFVKVSGKRYCTVLTLVFGILCQLGVTMGTCGGLFACPVEAPSRPLRLPWLSQPTTLASSSELIRGVQFQ